MTSDDADDNPDEGDSMLREAWDEQKSAYLEESLGKSHDMVMHAIIPYEVGGNLDLYYYPHGIPGTAIATKELSPIPGEGSKNSIFDNYEMVMFTRHPLDMDDALDRSTAFGKIHADINVILNLMARYSAQAELNGHETCEFPEGMDVVGGRCLVFDYYATHVDDQHGCFGLLLILEIFRSEMDFAREHGSEKLFEQLKARGVYPYSDMDREPVA